MQDSRLADRLNEIIRQADWFHVLESIRALDLPDCWLAGGAVRNTVWKVLYSDCSLTIKDLDVVFFDKHSGRELEKRCKEDLQTLHPEWVFDVKNQSGFGVWRPWQFVFSNSADGIAHFLHTATANGIMLSGDGELKVCTPYGLADLFDGIVRPTPFRHGDEALQKKQDEFLNKCPGLSLAE